MVKIIIMKVTIQKIAELCGVSIMTVSRVFNPEKAGMVKESTRKKVLAVAKQYNYHPVIIGKSFMTGKTYKIGLILDSMTDDLSSPTFSRFMEAVCDELQKNNYTLVLLLAKEAKKNNGANVRELLESKVADGYILGKSIVLGSVKDALDKMPVVLISQREDGISEPMPYVQINHPLFSAFRSIWRLIKPELRRSVAVFAPEDRYYYPRKSRAALIAEAAPKNARIKNFFVRKPAGFLVDRVNAALTAEEYFDELRKFKVIWASSDLYALGVMDVFSRHGLVPGKDYHLLGLDNLEPCLRGVQPVLTTFDLRWDEIGRTAVKTVLDLVSGKTVPEKELTVKPKLIRRTSL